MWIISQSYTSNGRVSKEQKQMTTDRWEVTHLWDVYIQISWIGHFFPHYSVATIPNCAGPRDSYLVPQLRQQTLGEASLRVALHHPLRPHKHDPLVTTRRHFLEGSYFLLKAPWRWAPAITWFNILTPMGSALELACPVQLFQSMFCRSRNEQGQHPTNRLSTRGRVRHNAPGTLDTLKYWSDSKV